MIFGQRSTIAMKSHTISTKSRPGSVDAILLKDRNYPCAKAPPAPEEPHGEHHRMEAVSGRRGQILVVDSDEQETAAIVAALTAAGHAVKWATTTIDGLL